MELEFFDCNCILGRHIDHVPIEPYTKAELLTDMAYFHITDALVVHAQSRDIDPVLGNRTVLIECENEPHLFPVWVLLPAATWEMEKPDILVESMMAEKVCAATLCPNRHNYSLSDWACRALLEELAAHSIPMLIDLSQISWDDVYRVCTEFPQLPVILTSVPYRSLRYLAPIWERVENLYVDTSWLTICDGYEWIVKRFGPKRLLFGSRYPIFTPGAAITALTYSNLDENVKQMIASENLKELLFL